ncbi:hypothetical protein CR513_52328, partial [Mucuna pruriens]
KLNGLEKKLKDLIYGTRGGIKALLKAFHKRKRFLDCDLNGHVGSETREFRGARGVFGLGN